MTSVLPRSTRVLRMLLAAALPAVLTPAFAADVDLSFRAGDTYTDNVVVSGTNPVSENILGVSSSLVLASRRPHLEANVIANGTWRHFASGTFDDQVLRGLLGDVRFNFFDGHMVWITTENYGPVLEDPLGRERPDNYTYDSFLSTGPQLVIGAVSQVHGVVGLRYQRSDFQAKGVPSNQQYSANLALVRPINATSESSLNAMYRTLRQDSVPPSSPYFGADYDIDMGEAYGRLKRTTGRDDFFVEAGVSYIGSHGDSSSTPLLRFGMGRALTSRVRLSTTAGSQYQDTLGRFQRLQQSDSGTGGDVSGPRNDVTFSISPVLDRYIDLETQYRGTRTNGSLRFTYNWAKEQRVAGPLSKQEYVGAALAAERQMRHSWSLDFSAEYRTRAFGNIGRNDNDLMARLGSTWTLLPKVDLRLAVSHRERHSDAVDADFTVNFAQLEFVFRPYSHVTQQESGSLNPASR